MTMDRTVDRTTTDETAVRAVIDGVYAAWADHDPDAFVSGYAETATATLPGAFLADREAIRATMAEVFTGPLKGSRGVAEVRSIKWLGGDVAVLRSDSSIVYAGATEPAPGESWRDTWILARTAGQWRVEAFHSSPASAA